MKDPAEVLKKLAYKQPGRLSFPWAKWFLWSVGAILALAGANDVLDFFDKSPVWSLPDPLLGISFHYLLPLAGLVELFIALLLTSKRTPASLLVVWLVINFAVYRFGLWISGWHHPWFFVHGLVNALNISPLLADCILLQVSLYLLAGSVMVLMRPQKKTVMPPEPVDYFKIHCLKCGGKTAFTTQWMGQTLPCPHCGELLTLKKTI